MAETDNVFDATLCESLDIMSSDLTPDPSIRADIRSRLKARHSLISLIGRTNFLPTPVGSFGTIAAAAVLALFVLTGSGKMPRNQDVPAATSPR